MNTYNARTTLWHCYVTYGIESYPKIGAGKDTVCVHDINYFPLFISLFLLCSLWFQFGYNELLFTKTGMMIFQSASHFLVYFNCSANPIALCFLSRTYRQYFMKYLCCKNGREFRGPIRFQKKSTFPLNPSTTKNSALDESLRTSSAETKTCTV